MKDLYLELSQSQMGKSLFEALNLPKPPELYRSPDRTLTKPQGRVLLAGAKGGSALKHIVSALDHESITLCSPSFDQELEALFSKHRKSKASQNVETVALNEHSNQRYRYMVFDATGLKQSTDLKALYEFFKVALPHLKKNGRIVILGLSDSDSTTVQCATLAGSLDGFVKSVAKEIGRKGASCNLIKLGTGSERQLAATLAFFLSDKSCFVTGQSLKLTYSANGARKIDWDQPLAGKVALVTGAAQGIGAETARILSRDGAKVVCLDIPANEAKLRQFAESIGGHALTLDLGEDNAPEDLSQTLASTLGVLDIVVHNAGITRDKTLARMPEHFWDQVIDINLDKILKINEKLFSKGLINPRGRIICISSISGIAGNFGQTNYACSKAGVAAYVDKTAPLLEDGITINAVAPGFIETEMTKRIPAMTRQLGRRTNSLGQGGLPVDVAEAVAYFCHPAAQPANGNILRVCGQSLIGR